MVPAGNQLLSAALLLLLGGVVVCFFGRRLFRVSLAIVGFVIGAGAASSIFGVSDRMPMMIAGLVGGLIGAGHPVCGVLRRRGAGRRGARGGGAPTWDSPSPRPSRPCCVLLCAVAGAVASTYLQRYFVIVASGFVGALMMVHGALLLAGRSFGLPDAGPVWVLYPFAPAPGQSWVPIAWIVLGVVGVAVQTGWTGGDKGRVGRRKPKPA